MWNVISEWSRTSGENGAYNVDGALLGGKQGAALDRDVVERGAHLLRELQGCVTSIRDTQCEHRDRWVGQGW